MKIEGNKVTENIYLCPDGKYRWAYEFPMLKNPSILLTIWKVFGIVLVLMLLLFSLIEAASGNISLWVKNVLFSPVILIVPCILFGLSIVAYLIVAGMYEWKYMILFEMDEEQIVHIQMPKQFEKAKALGWLAAMAGLIAGNDTAAGAGVLSTTKSRSVSVFANVKQVIGKQNLHLIKLNETLEHNQIYTDAEDFEFVWNYITQRCVNAKIK